MTTPVGGTASEPFGGDADFFAKIGADIPDEPGAEPTPAGGEGAPPAAPAATPEPPASPETQPRDDSGRFASKPKDEPAAPAPAEPVAPAPSPTAAPAAPALAPDLSQYPAYEYKAGTRSVPFTGAVRGSEGVLFPNDALPRLEQALAAAAQAHDQQSAWGRERVALQAQIKAAEELKNEVLGKLADIMQDPAKFDAWAADTQGNWEKLVLQAQLKMATQERDSRSAQYDEVVTEQQVAALVPQLRSAVTTTVDHLATHPEFKDLNLDPAWRAEFIQRVLDTRFDAVFYEADEAAVARGIATQVGETIFNPQPILDELRYQAGFTRKELARTKALADAAARNAATAPAAAATPVTGGKPAQTPSGTPKPQLHPGMSKGDVDRIVFQEMMED